MDSTQFERDERDPRPFPGPQTGKTSPYQFTPEELLVLKQCNRESFFQRCIPLSTILGTSAYYGVKTGYLQPNVRFGATPKVILAVCVGYFVGKFSYQGKCAEKLMHLPNSPLGQMLRQRRKGGFQESLEPGFGQGLSLSPFSSMSSTDTYSDVDSSKPNYDLDSIRPDIGELDDSHRPSLDTPIYEEEEMPPVQKSTTSYEELRKKNRDEYQQKRIGTFRSTEDHSPKYSLGGSSHVEDTPKTGPRRTNKYGDAFE